MKNGTAYGFVVLTILSILFLLNTASACVNPTDSFATEVLLNKPGSSYNLSRMIESDDVIVKTKESPIGMPDMPEPQMGGHLQEHYNHRFERGCGVCDGHRPERYTHRSRTG
jgi:hypothetical protein